MKKTASVGLVLITGLALAARAQDFSPPPAGQGWDDQLPDDMEGPAVSTANPYLPHGGDKLQATSVIETWEPTPRRLAADMMARYGPPDGVTSQALFWHHRGPWRQIVVRVDGAPHNFPFQHTDWLEQTIAYKVAPAKLSDLAAFDGSLLADQTRGELTARSESEASNLAALNLADEILTGKTTIDKARQELTHLVAQAAHQGAVSPYTKGLLFKTDSE